MSTKLTAAGVDWAVRRGDELYCASAHAYTDCFETDPPDLHIDVWLQGVFANTECTVCIPHAKAVAFGEALGRWAAEQRAAAKLVKRKGKVKR